MADNVIILKIQGRVYAGILNLVIITIIIRFFKWEPESSIYLLHSDTSRHLMPAQAVKQLWPTSANRAIFLFRLKRRLVPGNLGAYVVGFLDVFNENLAVACLAGVEPGKNVVNNWLLHRISNNHDYPCPATEFWTYLFPVLYPATLISTSSLSALPRPVTWRKTFLRLCACAILCSMHLIAHGEYDVYLLHEKNLQL